MQLFGDGHKFVTDADRIPGRNYLLNTSQALSAKATGQTGFVLGKYQFSSALDFNKKYLFHAILYSDNDGGRLYCGSYPNWSVYGSQEIKKGTNIISYSSQILQKNDGFMFTLDNCSAQVSLTEATLNEGTIIKEWQPAIEDYVMNNGLMKLFDLSKNNAPNPDNLASKTFDLNSKWYGMKVAQNDVPINGKENWSLYFDFELDGFDRIQLNISVNSNIYIRTFSGSNIWSDWKQIGG